MSEQITKQAAPWGQILARAVAAARTGGQVAGKGLGRYAQLMAGGDKTVLAKPNQMRQAILKVLGKQNAAQEQFFAAGTQAAGRNAPLTDRQLVIQKVLERLGKKADKMRQRLIPLDVAANREKELVGLARKATGNAATVAGAGTLGMAIGSRGEKKEAEAYLEGFRKMAEAWGVDPQALLKYAGAISDALMSPEPGASQYGDSHAYYANNAAPAIAGAASAAAGGLGLATHVAGGLGAATSAGLPIAVGGLGVAAGAAGRNVVDRLTGGAVTRKLEGVGDRVGAWLARRFGPRPINSAAPAVGKITGGAVATGGVGKAVR